MPAPRVAETRVAAGRRARRLLLHAGVLHDGAGGRLRDAGILVDDGIVAEIGSFQDVSASARGLAAADVAAVVPGFIDAHMHLLRAARDLAAVDCRPPAVRSIGNLLDAVRSRAATLAPDAWVEGAGYHEGDLAERRHPTADELDAAGGGRPVRLRHRSGHATLVGRLALRRAGIDAATHDPPRGRIERTADGELTGLLFGSAAALVRPQQPDAAQLAAEVAALSREWLALGITMVCDAGPDNDAGTLALLGSLALSRALRQRVVVMRGAGDALRDGRPAEPWVIPRELAARVWAGHVKFMLTTASGSVEPDARHLRRSVQMLAQSHQACALHVAGVEQLEVALAAVETAALTRGRLQHRLEHVTVLPDELVGRLVSSGVAVVMHPLFVRRHGDRYLEEREHPAEWLHRCATLLRAGVHIAAGSDAPVVSPHPLESVAAAMTRRTVTGTAVGDCERVDFATALALHTRNAAELCGRSELGRLRPGAPADMVVLPVDPAQLAPAELAALPVTATLIGGEVASGSIGHEKS